MLGVILIPDPPRQLRNYSSDLGKQPRRVPKRRQAARELSTQRRSALNVRLFLRDFCSEFLENCYNRLMGLVKVRASEGWSREVAGPVVGKKGNLGRLTLECGLVGGKGIGCP